MENAVDTFISFLSDRYDTEPQSVIIGLGLLSAGVALFLIFCCLGGRKGGGARRTDVTFFGIPNGGKTTVFGQLVHHKFLETQMSVQPNIGKYSYERSSGSKNSEEGGEGGGKKVNCRVVDYPGHKRLRSGLKKIIQSSNVLVLVVDSVLIHDDQGEGAQAVSELLCEVLRWKEITDVKGIIVACNKRDQVTSYAAKSVKKLLSIEMARLLHSHSGSISSVGKVGVQSTDAENPMFAVDPDSKNFSFENSEMHFDFVDVTAVDKHEKYSLQALEDAIADAY